MFFFFYVFVMWLVFLVLFEISVVEVVMVEDVNLEKDNNDFIVGKFLVGLLERFYLVGLVVVEIYG